jgi:hypothetical protein
MMVGTSGTGLQGAGNGPSKLGVSQSPEVARSIHLSADLPSNTGVPGDLPAAKRKIAMSEGRSAAFWWMFILALMAINLGVAGMAVYMTVGDPSFRPLPNYSQDAIDWQVRKDRQLASDRLGWRATYERSLEPLGIVVRVVDRDGRGLIGQGTLHAYHFTRVAEHRKAVLLARGDVPGEYFAELDVGRDGKWQLSFEFQREGDETSIFVEEIQKNWERP